jgi:hypothetical protein
LPLAQLSVTGVTEWLLAQDLPVFVDAFRAARINGEMLAGMDAEDLEEVGAGLRVQRRRLIVLRDRAIATGGTFSQTGLHVPGVATTCNDTSLEQLTRPPLLRSLALADDSRSPQPDGRGNDPHIISWAPWLAHLRDALSHLLPLTSAEFDAAGWLLGLRVAERQRAHLESIEALWRDLLETVLVPLGIAKSPPGKRGRNLDISPEGVHAAIDLVRSRAHRSRGTSGDLLLVPLMDMANHDAGLCRRPETGVGSSHTPPKESAVEAKEGMMERLDTKGRSSFGGFSPVWHYNGDARQMELRAARAYSPGETVDLCYGALDSVDLLLRYRFAHHRNPNDAVQFETGTPRLVAGGRRSHRKKLKRWRRMGDRSASFAFASREAALASAAAGESFELAGHLPTVLSTKAGGSSGMIPSAVARGAIALPSFAIHPALGAELTQVPLRLVQRGMHGRAAAILGFDSGRFTVGPMGDVPTAQLAALRYHSLDLADGDALRAEATGIGDTATLESIVVERLVVGAPLTAPSEVRMRAALANAASAALARFPTTIEDDEATLAATGCGKGQTCRAGTVAVGLPEASRAAAAAEIMRVSVLEARLQTKRILRAIELMYG